MPPSTLGCWPPHITLVEALPPITALIPWRSPNHAAPSLVVPLRQRIRRLPVTASVCLSPPPPFPHPLLQHLAKEIVQSRKAVGRMYTNKAQLISLGTSLTEQLGERPVGWLPGL